MKRIIATIEKNEDSFFAFSESIPGCVAGGVTYEEVKDNLFAMIEEFKMEDSEANELIGEQYNIQFQVDLGSVFNLIPEINVTQLAHLMKMNSGLLRQYASGAKIASEDQTQRIMKGINQLSQKLSSIELISLG